MTGGSSEKVTPPKIPDVRIPDVGLDPRLNDPRVRAWFDEHAAEMRSYAYGQRVLYEYLAIAIVLGLVAHSAGYLLRAAATTDLLGLLADLLYTLGFALWTGAVIVVFIQLLPQAKRRQVRRALEAYEAAERDNARQGSDAERTAKPKGSA